VRKDNRSKKEIEYLKFHTCPTCYYKKYYYRITKTNYRCLLCKTVFKYDRKLEEFVICNRNVWLRKAIEISQKEMTGNDG